MKKITAFIAAIVLSLVFVIPASAQFRFGPKVGICVNDLHFNQNIIGNTDNRTGFTGGIMVDGTVPLLGFGFDASAMYVRRDAGKEIHCDYIAIPVNIKYRFSFPIVNRIVVPFLTTGPEWAYMVHNTKVKDMSFTNSNFSWNFGLGVELFRHLQVAGSYGLGLTKTYKVAADKINGKNRFWTVTAAWLF